MQAVLGSILVVALALTGLVASTSPPTAAATLATAPLADPDSSAAPNAPAVDLAASADDEPEVGGAAVQVALRLSESDRFAQYSARLASWVADAQLRDDILRTVLTEAQRARLDPFLVLAIIQVESSFRPLAVSSAGARGLMQVMPFWAREMGAAHADLFTMAVNVRFGCDILRHYLALENGDLQQALSRYKGTPGRLDYSRIVIDAWRHWRRDGVSV